MHSAIVEDSLFRQRYRFSRSGDVLRVEIWTDPGGGVLAEHVHRALAERYEVLEGEVTSRPMGRRAVRAPATGSSSRRACVTRSRTRARSPRTSWSRPSPRSGCANRSRTVRR